MNHLTDPKVYFNKMSERLRQTLGEPELLHRSSPLAYCNGAVDVLIATILTQATSDRNALRSWRQFKRTFPEPESVLTTDEATLAEVIRSGGLANQKAKTIRAVLKAVQERFPGFYLAELGKDPTVARELLLSLPGVGPKTAACVLLFGLNLPAFPVDTHIHRIVVRMGLVNSKTSPGKTEELLTSIIPPRLHSALHILLLNLGRKYCRPKQPNCAECPLNQDCKKIF